MVVCIDAILKKRKGSTCSYEEAMGEECESCLGGAGRAGKPAVVAQETVSAAVQQQQQQKFQGDRVPRKFRRRREVVNNESGEVRIHREPPVKSSQGFTIDHPTVLWRV